MIYPVIRYGSRGAAVLQHQRTLNAWNPGLFAPLAEDADFGLKTDAATRTFQRQNQLDPDGVVGPKTWAVLQPLIDKLVGLIEKPQAETDFVERAIQIAESALATFGFPGEVTLSPTSPRIAAAKCCAPDNPFRPRQGGGSLKSIFHIAGAPAVYTERCLSISPDAEAKWQENGATAWRNNHDLPAWCGIFTYYVYRLSGIPLGAGWTSHGDNIHKDKRFIVSPLAKDAKRGAIGVLDGIRNGGRNHHFLVTDNDAATGVIRSIDGNTHGPNQSNFQGNFSTVARRTYSYGELKQLQTYFLFPNFAKM